MGNEISIERISAKLDAERSIWKLVGELCWRLALQYDPAHDGAKRNIAQAERLLKGLQERQQKQGK